MNSAGRRRLIDATGISTPPRCGYCFRGGCNGRVPLTICKRLKLNLVIFYYDIAKNFDSR